MTESGCRLKLASILQGMLSNLGGNDDSAEGAYLGSLLSSCRAGEFSDILSILTGCVLTQDRKISWMSAYVAVVLSDPAQACEREIL